MRRWNSSTGTTKIRAHATAAQRRARRTRRLACEPLETRNLLASIYGDFDGNGTDDLAVGVPGEDVGTVEDAGAVNVIYGFSDGLASTGNQLIHQSVMTRTPIDALFVAGTAERHDRLAFALAAGDFNGDGRDDLAIGVPFEDVGVHHDAGAVVVLYGTPNGLEDRGELWHQGLTVDGHTVKGTTGDGDRFGFALAAGDFNRDGRFDLAVGAPGESDSSATFAGAVNILYGSPNGLTAQHNDLFKQGSGGVMDNDQQGDHFGFSLAVGNFGNTVHHDLAIGAPFEDLRFDSTREDTGVVHVLFGADNGLSGIDSQLWSQTPIDGAGDLVGSSEPGDGFGYSLAAANFGAGFRDDLAIGVPFEDIGDIKNGGAINILYSDFAGLTANGNQGWHQDSIGIKGTVMAEDQFGYALAAADFGESGFADLAVGIPFDDDGAVDGGAVQVLYGSSAGTGLSDVDQLWHQGTSGISGAPEAGDGFGYTLAAGDFGNGAQADLAVGVPFEDLGSISDVGGVSVIYGTSTGLRTTNNEIWHQDTTGIRGVAEVGDNFGCMTTGSLGKGAVSCMFIDEPIDDQFPDINHTVHGSHDSSWSLVSRITDEQIANMEAWIHEKLDGNVVGFQFGVAQSGVIRYRSSYGKADVSSSLDMQPDMKMNLASVSKIITAITVLKLAEDGRLDLNAPFYEYLDPEYFPAHAIDATVKRMTVKELLTHTGQLGENGASSTEAVQAMLAKPRQAQNCYDFATTGQYDPPARCTRLYQNSGFYLLRRVAEGAAGITTDNYANFVRNQWLDDIGLGDMTCEANPDMRFYTQDDADGGTAVTHGGLTWHEHDSNDTSNNCGSGGWRGSADDLLTMMVALRKHQILSPAMTRFLVQSDLADATRTPGETAIGWDVPKGETLVKGGRLPYRLRTKIARFPNNVDAVILLNFDDDAIRGVLEYAYNNRHTPPAPAPLSQPGPSFELVELIAGATSSADENSAVRHVRNVQTVDESLLANSPVVEALPEAWRGRQAAIEITNRWRSQPSTDSRPAHDDITGDSFDCVAVDVVFEDEYSM